ncbi:MAG: hypothetical protein J3K34DRAFT_421949 [Monoraphidium minutum]|nr:MAG: hypothetical protein J3K34DRAFT_421949 [Monoraphidium minutum]
MRHPGLEPSTDATGRSDTPRGLGLLQSPDVQQAAEGKATPRRSSHALCALHSARRPLRCEPAAPWGSRQPRRGACHARRGDPGAAPAQRPLMLGLSDLASAWTSTWGLGFCLAGSGMMIFEERSSTLGAATSGVAVIVSGAGLSFFISSGPMVTCGMAAPLPLLPGAAGAGATASTVPTGPMTPPPPLMLMVWPLPPKNCAPSSARRCAAPGAGLAAAALPATARRRATVKNFIVATRGAWERGAARGAQQPSSVSSRDQGYGYASAILAFVVGKPCDRAR